MKQANKNTAPKAVKVAGINAKRNAYVGSKAKQYGALKEYAFALEEQFGPNWWLIAPKGPVSDNEAKVREAIKQEKALVQKAAEQKGLSNIWKPWSDVLAYVRGDKAKKGAKANEERDIFLRLEQELTKEYNAIQRDSRRETEELLTASFHIAKALEAIGFDISKLEKAEEA